MALSTDFEQLLNSLPFRGAGQSFEAEAPQEFWKFYKPEKDGFLFAGYRLRKEGESWMVVFDPTKAGQAPPKEVYEVDFKNGFFLYRSPYDRALVESLKSAGAFWNPEEKVWLLRDQDSLDKVYKYFPYPMTAAAKAVYSGADTESHCEPLREDVKQLLRGFQVAHTERQVAALKRFGVTVDTSRTGSGKTFCALAVCKQMGLRPIVVCPKSVISSWKKAAKYMGVEPVLVSNYEQFRIGNTKYLETTGEKNEKKFTWHIPEGSVLVFDEAHRCGGRDTQNAKMMIAANGLCPISALSATLADNPLQMQAVGTILQLFPPTKTGYWAWARENGVRDNPWGGCTFSGNRNDVLRIHHQIFEPGKGSQISVDEIDYPQEVLIADPLDMGSVAEKAINKAYQELRAAEERLHSKIEEDMDKGVENILTIRLRARQQVELAKVPTIIEMAQDYLEEGNSVAIFLNFRDSVDAVAAGLKTKAVVVGGQNAGERDQWIERFQADQERVIVCNIMAGGVGISLHDEHGNFPRVSMISPSDSARDVVQALGRIKRSGARSPVVQRFLFCAGTIEEEVANNVNMKIRRIDTLNDGDLLSTGILGD